jgi:hypothetical protein
MSFETLIHELSALKPQEQRRAAAFLVSLEDGRDGTYAEKLAEKIDKSASEFATLDELDKRLGLSCNGDRQ